MDSWDKQSKFVLEELKRLNGNFERSDNKLTQLHMDLISLKTRASVWGAVAGVVPGLLGAGLAYFFTKN